MKAFYSRLTLLLLLTVLLPGCGFHLRDSDALVRQAPVHITGLNQYAPLYRAMRSSMTASGIRLVESDKLAKSIMKIRDHGESQQIITIDSRGKATEYMLIRKVTVSLADKDGKQLVKDHEVGVRRNWIEVGKTGLAGYREASELREEMLQDISLSILRVLDYSLR